MIKMTAIMVLALLAGTPTEQGDLLLVNADIRTVDEMPWMADMTPVLIETDCFLALAGASQPDGVEYSVVASSPVDLNSFRVVYFAQIRRDTPELPGETVLVTERFLLIMLEEPSSDAVFVPGIGCLRPLRMFYRNKEEGVQDLSGMNSLIIDQIAAEVSEDTLLAVIDHLQSYGTRYTTTPQYDACADWADTKMETYGVASQQQTFFYSGDSMSNVIGEITGIENPENIYIICGHLDSAANTIEVAPGADDNGSGSACVMEAARVMAPYSYRNTVRFVLFAAEEAWMVGSEYYVEQAYQQGENILGAVNADMLLYAPGVTDSVFIPYNDQSEPLAVLAGDMFATYAPDVFPRVVYDPSAPSDHASFWLYGYSAIEIAEASAEEIWGGYNPNYHTPTDILENYLPSFPYGTDLSRAAVALIATLADPIELSIEVDPSNVAWSVSISSNPCSGVLGVFHELPEGSSEFRIFDITGRTIAAGPLSGSGQTQIGLQGLPGGVYTMAFPGTLNISPIRFALTN